MYDEGKRVQIETALCLPTGVDEDFVPRQMDPYGWRWRNSVYVMN